MSSLLGMKVGKSETTDDIAERIVGQHIDAIDRIKRRGLWTDELQRLEDAVVDLPDDATPGERDEAAEALARELVRVRHEYCP